MTDPDLHNRAALSISFSMHRAPKLRVRQENDAPVRPEGRYVLYWMTSHRRARWSWPLQHAAFWADALGRPLVVLEGLRAGYRWASDRFHRFAIDGMADNAARCAEAGVVYLPYVEPEDGQGKGLLEALAADACLVVADHYPAFFLPRMLASAAWKLPVRLSPVDGNGLVPLGLPEKESKAAASFRRRVHRWAPELLASRPVAEPLVEVDAVRSAGPLVDEALLARWPMADLPALRAEGGLAALPIDHDVRPVSNPGGAEAAEAALSAFVTERLSRYHERRNHPDQDGQSGLSPWLHWGHLSAEEAIWRVLDEEGFDPGKLRPERAGAREGFWGLSPGAESFLDELITWRELGYVFAHHRPDHAGYRSLPSWARQSLAAHRGDEREALYSLAELEQAATHDEVWNAAQRELVEEGRIHNYLRMLWGKKVIAWSPSPEEAFERLVELNNKYGVDGRDPNSYAGIAWCFGRFDRAWGPERPVFGKIRYMTSESAKRKLKMKAYLSRWSASMPSLPFG